MPSFSFARTRKIAVAVLLGIFLAVSLMSLFAVWNANHSIRGELLAQQELSEEFSDVTLQLTRAAFAFRSVLAEGTADVSNVLANLEGVRAQLDHLDTPHAVKGELALEVERGVAGLRREQRRLRALLPAYAALEDEDPTGDDTIRTLAALNATLDTATENAIEQRAMITAAIERTARELTASLDRTSRFLTVSVVAGLLLAATVGWWVNRKLSCMLDQMNEAADQLRRGNLSHRIDSPFDDRIGRVARAIDEMAGALEQTENALASALRDLEQRNRDLGHGNEKLKAEIAERERAQAEMQQAKEAAEQANNAKSEFLANISHELRTPLHGILSFASFGIKKHDSAPPEKLRSYFEKIDISGNTLLSLVSDLLDLAKLEAGRMVIEIQPAELGALMTSVVDEFNSLLCERDLTVQRELQWARVDVVADADRIRQVLRNLLGNAVKFSAPGGKILIESRVRGETVSISVRDQGPGIPEEELESVFDKFIQSSRTKTGAGGTGLGLAICREIVTAHGGEIRAENHPDGGAAFTFEIPLDAKCSRTEDDEETTFPRAAEGAEPTTEPVPTA